jgi:protein-tyrosine-phosphatase
MAEGLFRKAIASRGDYQVSSAGTSASPNTPASRETTAILKKLGAPLSGFSSRPVSEKILSEASHVFAMTTGHLNALESRFPEHADKFYLVREFSENSANPDIPDPIGMGKAAYEEVASILETAIPSIIAYIDSTTKEM